jgi:hypothetical protein
MKELTIHVNNLQRKHHNALSKGKGVRTRGGQISLYPTKTSVPFHALERRHYNHAKRTMMNESNMILKGDKFIIGGGFRDMFNQYKLTAPVTDTKTPKEMNDERAFRVIQDALADRTISDSDQKCNDPISELLSDTDLSLGITRLLDKWYQCLTVTLVTRVRIPYMDKVSFLCFPLLYPYPLQEVYGIPWARRCEFS